MLRDIEKKIILPGQSWFFFFPVREIFLYMGREGKCLWTHDLAIGIIIMFWKVSSWYNIFQFLNVLMILVNTIKIFLVWWVLTPSYNQVQVLSTQWKRSRSYQKLLQPQKLTAVCVSNTSVKLIQFLTKV